MKIKKNNDKIYVEIYLFWIGLGTVSISSRCLPSTYFLQLKLLSRLSEGINMSLNYFKTTTRESCFAILLKSARNNEDVRMKSEIHHNYGADTATRLGGAHYWFSYISQRAGLAAKETSAIHGKSSKIENHINSLKSGLVYFSLKKCFAK